MTLGCPIPRAKAREPWLGWLGFRARCAAACRVLVAVRCGSGEAGGPAFVGPDGLRGLPMPAGWVRVGRRGVGCLGGRNCGGGRD
jgi:hypothetical protein